MRQREAIRSAWSVANEKGGGRKESLKYLAERHVDLKGLYGGGGYFAEITLAADSDLSWSDLEDANFEGAKLASVKLEGANLSGVRFNNALLTNASFRMARLFPKMPNFDGADIAGADFREVTILAAGGYQVFTKAKNWQKANFDERTRKLIECSR